ncbi:MFS transporter [Streptomyces sp. NPDC086787]|uniref:MFS transporter n=1 Tax=Streptomyces sp. NPDC086787 TaxID=3365759 RepID=UPI0037F3BC8A
MINRNFTLIWTGQALSDIAGEMTSLALPLAVLATTHSATDAGLVGTASGIALMVTMLPGGLIADTVDRRRLMIFCDAARAAVAVLLALALFTGRLSTPLAVAAAAATAVLTMLFSPAEGGLLREVIPAGRRREAMTRNVVRSNVAIAVGPPIGGVLLGLGAPLAFALDAASYLVSMLLLSLVRHRRRPAGPAAPAERTLKQSLRHLGVELTLGIPWLVRRRALLALVAWVAYINLLGRAVELLAAVDSSDLGHDPAAAGIVLSAAGCGGIVGGITAGWVLRRMSPTAIVTTVTAAWLVLIPLTATGSQPVTVVAVFLLVLGLPTVGSLARLTVSTDAPTHMQGRVGTAVVLGATSVAWLGPGVTGYLISAGGVVKAALVLAAPLTVALALLAVSRRLRTALNSLGQDPEETTGADTEPQEPAATEAGGR